MSIPETAAKKRRGRIEEPAMIDGEEWRPINGFPGYEVSSLGRVRAIRILSTFKRNGYESLGLYRAQGRQRNVRINRLVCEAFHGAPEDGQEAAHLDGNSFNNRADNLAWATKLENESHKIAHGTRGTKLNPDSVVEIRSIVARGVRTQTEVARQFGVSPGHVSGICSGAIWSGIGDRQWLT